MHDWQTDSICLQTAESDLDTVAAQIYQRTCRRDLDQPGFCLWNLGSDLRSTGFRQTMVDLKDAMCRIHESISGRTLTYLSAARFDQQTSTKPHLDAGPEECFLMLGYEPSDVDSELEIGDYSKCARDLGISPKEFLKRHNPMFRDGHQMLEPYTTRIPCFSKTDYQIICVNNSSSDCCEPPRWLGTLHTASIPAPDESKRRIINSTMIASAPIGTPNSVDESMLRDFVETTRVRRRGYDKQHLSED